MSCDKWNWQEICDHRPCCGDCDLCSYPEEEMAKLKVEANRDTELVKFEALQVGEVFIADGKPHYKFDAVNALRISDSVWKSFDDDDLVTYVKRAELKLTI